jgi:hypothetical protein
MTATSKQPHEHVGDVLNQLKEMRHYSKTNVERLTAQWMLFEGELSKLKETDHIEDLMTRQAELHDALEAEIERLESMAAELAPKADTDEGGTTDATRH